jgi:hypothetical protein
MTKHSKESVEAMADARLVPGVMRCAKCAFQLVRTTLYMSSGTTGPGNSKTEPCPNGCGPLWPVTWKDRANEGHALAEQYFWEAKQLRESIAALQARIEELEADRVVPEAGYNPSHDDGESYASPMAMNAAMKSIQLSVFGEIDSNELSAFRKTTDDWEDCGESDTPHEKLIRWALMGLLDCERFTISEKGYELLAASPTPPASEVVE